MNPKGTTTCAISGVQGRTLSDLELGDVMDLRYGNSFRMAGRVCCVQAVNISQQEEPISPH